MKSALVPGPEYQLVTFWPLTAPPAVPMEALIRAVGPELPGRARSAGAALAGTPSWRRCPGHKVPGAGAYAEVLVCTVPAVRVPRNRDKIAARLEATR